LKVEGLTVYQGSYLAVRDVSFELLPGTGYSRSWSEWVKAPVQVTDLTPRGRLEIEGRPIERLTSAPAAGLYGAAKFYLVRSFPRISVSELVGLGWVTQEHDCAGRRHQLKGEKQAARKPHGESVTICGNKRSAPLQRGELKAVAGLLLSDAPANFWCWMAFAGGCARRRILYLLNELKREEGWTVLQAHDMVSRHRVLCSRTLVCSAQPAAHEKREHDRIQSR